MYYLKQHIYYKQMKDKQVFIASISTNAGSFWLFL